MHHCYADARSMWVFWDAFLETVVRGASPAIPDLAASTQPPNLPPARDDLLGLPPWPSIQGWLKSHDLVMSAMKPDLVLLPPSSPLPTTGEPKDWPAGPGDFVRHSISESQTAAVVAACKARGITVAAAFYAALASATRVIQEADGSRLPKSLPPNYGCGLGVDYHVMIPFALDMITPPIEVAERKVEEAPQERSLDELAQDMNAFFQSTRRDFGPDPAGLDALTYYVRSMFVPATLAPSAPIFSSLGVAEHFIRRSFPGVDEAEEKEDRRHDGRSSKEEEGHHRRGPTSELEVEDTYVMTLGAKLLNCVILHTFKGKICALSSFDESYFRAELLEGLLAGTFQKLLAWLEGEH
ncbi:hypothetical protein PG993_003041 [Apiospora rasikravindrae]|uniref:Uncharacterized protein n=1 Tax=Apiospora rasikravindrae TaxID=990691 RepID=A0ABR1TYE3_9PEZI